MSIRRLVEARVGQVSDDLYEEACEQTTNDVKANRLLIGITGIDPRIIDASKVTTNINYIVDIMVRYIEIVNGQKEKAICQVA